MDNNNNTKRPLLSSVIITSLAALIIFGLSAAFFIIPDREMSENENRVLASAPEITMGSLISGKLTEDVTDWFSDQFPCREFFVSLKGSVERLLGKRENNGVIYTDGGYMIDRLTADFDTVTKNFASLSKLNGAVKTPITVAVAPRKIDALASLLPDALADTGADALAALNALYVEFGFDAVDLYSPLTDAANAGDYVYYKTDHHPTEHGAYLIYLALAEEWGFMPYDRDSFTVECVSDDFYGTTWSASVTNGADADKIELYRYDGDDEYTVHIIDNDKTLRGFYDTDYLSKKDKYALFLSGTNARVTVTADENNSMDREKLLILNDSFANAVTPFLARHYDIELLDPRFLRRGLYDTLASGEYDRVLLLMNLDTLSTSPLLAVVSAGIE